ncbi:trehalose operon repressor [Lacticaseibacillus suihuaensis]
MAKFNLVYHDIKTKIDEGIYKTNALLPSENALAQLYGASRDTIRRALARLRDEGFIQSQRGKGSVVINQQQYTFPVSGVVSYHELAARLNLNAKTTLIEKTKTKLPAKVFASIDAGAKAIPVTKLVRVRTVNDEPVIIDTDYLDATVIPDIPDQAATNSIYAYFEDELKLSIAYSKKEITVEKATPRDQELLHLTASDPIVVIRSVSSLEDTTQFQYTESRHRADRFRFQEFARRS